MASPQASSTAYRYKAFVSYSHAADGTLAPALESALERFGKPWYRLRAMRVFRDKTGLAVTPELWESIVTALQQSEYFILLASPLAAASQWVQDEVAWWLQHRQADRLLIVLTDGEIAWDAASADFNWSTTNALPRCLQRVYKGVPLFGDLRWAEHDSDLSLQRPRFLETVAGLTATLLQRPLDDIIGEDIAQHRKAMRTLRLAIMGGLAVTGLALLALFLVFGLRSSVGPIEIEHHERIEAQKQATATQEETQRLAEQKQHAAAASTKLAAQAANVLEQDRDLSRLLALEAVRIAPTREAERALRQTLLEIVPPVVLEGHSQPVSSVRFSSDSQRLLTGSADGTARLWEASTGTNLLTLRVCEAGEGWADAFLSADGTKVLTVVEPESLEIGHWESGAVQLHDARTGNLLVSLPDVSAVTAALRADGREIVTAGFGTTVRIWDALTGQLRAELSGHEQRVASTSYSANDKWILTASWDGTARLWDATTGQNLAVLKSPEGVGSAFFTKDGSGVMTVGDDRKTLRLWDWGSAPGSSKALFSGHEGSIHDFAVSQDGKWLATGSADNTARIWDIASGKCLYVLRGHEEFVNGVDFSPDGKWLVTASGDGTARLWEVATGEQVTELGWSEWPRTSVTFSPDGRRIATGTAKGPVGVYNCAVCGSVSDLVALAQARATRELTAAEKEQYLGSLP